MAAEQSGKDLGLGFAKLWELLGDVRHRAMMLAHLLSGVGCAGRSSEPVAGQRLGEHLGALAFGRGVDQRTITLLEIGDAVAGERPNGVLSPGLGEEPQRARGEVVVGLLELVATGVADREHLGRASAATVTVDALIARLERPLGEQMIEVTAYGRRGQVEPLGQCCRGRRTVLEDAVRHALTGRSVVERRRLGDPYVFHNISVPLILHTFNKGAPKSSGTEGQQVFGVRWRGPYADNDGVASALALGEVVMRRADPPHTRETC